MIDNQFELTKILGKGGSSKVFLANDLEGKNVAIKAIRKDKNYAESAAAVMLQREHEILQKLEGHPNIIKSFAVNLDGLVFTNSESESVMYNVIEYAKYGAISNFIRFTGALEEEIARLYILQLWNAVSYTHSLGHAHLDIKLENILLDEFFNLKLADFGSSVSVTSSNGLTNKRRGTILYMAPEVVDLQQNEEFNALAADIYSLGITIFVLLTGEFPTPQEIRNISSIDESDKRTSCSMEVDSEQSIGDDWNQFSKEVKLLLKSMLNPDPQKRPTIFEILSTPWLNHEFSWDILSEVYHEMDSRKEHMNTLAKRMKAKNR